VSNDYRIIGLAVEINGCELAIYSFLITMGRLKHTDKYNGHLCILFYSFFS